MGKMKDDLQLGVIYPLGCLLVSVTVWELIFSRICQKIDISEKSFYGILTAVMYSLQWAVTNPHAANIIPIAPSMDFYLFFSAGYFLRTVNKQENLVQVIYSIVSVITILDFITFRKGGDVAVCYLFLTEFPDLLITVILRFTCSDALVAVADCLLHLSFRVIMFGYLVVAFFNQTWVSEDIKMKVFIVHAFSYISLPGIVIETAGRFIGEKLKYYRRVNLLRCCYTMRRARSRRRCRPKRTC